MAPSRVAAAGAGEVAVRVPGGARRALDRVGLPREHHHRVRAGRPAGLRRRRGHGLAPTRSARRSRRCGGSSDHHGVPVLAIHAPCLLITQRVWTTDPWAKLERSRAAAEALGASTRSWCTRRSAGSGSTPKSFVGGAGPDGGGDGRGLRRREHVPVARAGPRDVGYAPGWDPVGEDYPHVTLDLSHTAVSGSDALAMARTLGRPAGPPAPGRRLRVQPDEHLVPGRGTQPCAELLERLAGNGFAGTVVLEVVDPARRQPGRPRGGPRRGARLRPPEPRRRRALPLDLSAPPAYPLPAVVATRHAAQWRRTATAGRGRGSRLWTRRWSASGVRRSSPVHPGPPGSRPRPDGGVFTRRRTLLAAGYSPAEVPLPV